MIRLLQYWSIWARFAGAAVLLKAALILTLLMPVGICQGGPETFDPHPGRAFHFYHRQIIDPPRIGAVGLGDPVFASSGEFVEQKTDLRVRSLGIDFAHTRAWRSLSDYDGPLGKGWDFRYNERIVAQVGPDNKIEVLEFMDGSGRVDRFWRWDLMPPAHSLPVNLPVSMADAFAIPPKTVSFIPPTAADQADPPQIFYPSSESGSSEIVGLVGGEIIRWAPGNMRVTYELALRHDQLVPSTNTAAFNAQILSMYPGAQDAVANASGTSSSAQIAPMNSAERYYRVKKYEDFFGNTISFNYAPSHPFGAPLVSDQLTEVIDTEGRPYSFTYYSALAGSLAGLLHEVTDFVGRRIHYKYDSDCNLTDVTELEGTPSARTTQYGYASLPNGFFGLKTITLPEQVAAGAGKTATRNRYFGRRLLKQEYGADIVPNSMKGDPGNPDEPCFSFSYIWHSPSGSIPIRGGTPLPHASSVIFINRNAISEEFKFDQAGRLSIWKHFGEARTYTNSYVWTHGRITSHTSPQEDPSEVTQQGMIETWEYDHAAIDPRGRGRLTAKSLIPEVNSEASMGESASTWTYSNYNALWELPGSETAPAGTSVTRSFSTIGSGGSTTGFRMVEVVAGGTESTTTTLERDLLGRLVKKQDALGNRFESSYAAGTGNLQSESYVPVRTSESDMVLRSWTHDARGNRITETDSNGNTTTFVFDLFDRRIEIQYPGAWGYKSTFEYNRNNDLVRSEKPVEISADLVTERQYDLLGNVTQTRVDRTGAGDWLTTTYDYDPGERLISVTGPEGVETSYLWTTRGRVFRETYGVGLSDSHVIEHQYNHIGLEIEYSSSAGRFSSHEYDRLGRLVAVEDALGTRTENTWTGPRVTTKTVSDAAGVQHKWYRYEHDGLGRVTKQEVRARAFPGGPDIGDGWQTNVTEFDALGRPIAQIDDRGDRVDVDRDGLGRVEKVTDALGNELEFAYWGATEKYIQVVHTEVTTPGYVGGTAVKTHGRSYDALGRTTASTDPAGLQTSVESTFAGLPLLIVAPDGSETTSTYDRLGNLIDKSRSAGPGQPFEQVESRFYDAAGRLSAIGDGSGALTTFGYDPRSRVSTRTLADGTSESWTYNEFNEVLTHTDTRGSAKHFTYDVLGRVERVDRTPGAGVIGDFAPVLYEYDALSNVVRAEDGDSILSWSYTTLGGVAAEAQDYGAGQRLFLSNYDETGLRTSVAFPAFGALAIGAAYSYDQNGRVASIDGVVNGVPANLASYGYQGASRLIEARMAHGNTCTYSYDPRGLLKELKFTHNGLFTADLLTVELIRDNLGRPGWRNLSQAGPSGTYYSDLQAFTYDSANRLQSRFEGVTNPPFTSAATPAAPVSFSSEEGFSWNLEGTRNSLTRTGAPATTYGYNITHDLTSASIKGVPHTMTPDVAGNRVAESWSSNVQSFAYDMDNRMASLTLPDGSSIARKFDAIGRPFEETHTSVSGISETTRWYFDGEARVMEVEVNGTGEDLAGVCLYGPVGAAPFLQIEVNAGAIQRKVYTVADERGSVAALIDCNGDLVQHYRYSSDFGEITGYVADGSVPTPLGLLPFAARKLWQGKHLIGLASSADRSFYEAGQRVWDSKTCTHLQREWWSSSPGRHDTPSSGLDRAGGTPDNPLSSFGAPRFGAEPPGGGGEGTGGGGGGIGPTRGPPASGPGGPGDGGGGGGGGPSPKPGGVGDYDRSRPTRDPGSAPGNGGGSGGAPGGGRWGDDLAVPGGSREEPGGGATDAPEYDRSTAENIEKAKEAAAAEEAVQMARFRAGPNGKQWAWARSVIIVGDDGVVRWYTGIFYHKEITQAAYERSLADAELSAQIIDALSITLEGAAMLPGPVGIVAGTGVALIDIARQASEGTITFSGALNSVAAGATSGALPGPAGFALRAGKRAARGGLRKGLGNIGSHGPMSADDALRHGQNWLGKGYKEVGPSGSGVFRSADGTRQFRMAPSDLAGSHGDLGPHIHFEALNPQGKVIENLHIPLME